jgi:hypothetical protein
VIDVIVAGVCTAAHQATSSAAVLGLFTAVTYIVMDSGNNGDSNTYDTDSNTFATLAMAEAICIRRCCGALVCSGPLFVMLTLESW